MSPKALNRIRKVIFFTGIILFLASVVMLAAGGLTPHEKLGSILLIIVAVSVSLSAGLQLRNKT